MPARSRLPLLLVLVLACCGCMDISMRTVHHAAADDLAAWAGSPLAKRGIVMLAGELDEVSAAGVAARMLTLDAEGGPTRITLLVNSNGGGSHAWLAIRNAIRSVRKPVDIVNTGNCLSAASAVMQDATGRRLAYPGTSFMVHRPRAESEHEMEAQVARIQRIYTDAVRGRSRLPAAWFPLDDTRRFFSAEEALAYGFIDAVIATLPE